VRRLAIAERDRAGLVEQEDVDVAGRLHRAARHGDHVLLDHPVHPGDAMAERQRPDRRRDQAHEQGTSTVTVTGVPAGRLHAVERVRKQRGRREQEDDGQARQQDVQRDLVRGLLPLRPLDERDHPVEEGRAGSAVTSTMIQSESTWVPPVTELRSPPLPGSPARSRR